jgi:hypothetical protein
MVTPEDLRALASRSRLERDIEERMVEAAMGGADEYYSDAVVQRLLARYAAFRPVVEHSHMVLSWE